MHIPWNGWNEQDFRTNDLLAGFVATPITGTAPLRVEFMDQSTPAGVADEWRRAFGDGVTSTQASPVYTYTQSGAFTVTQWVTDTATGEVGVLTRTHYITVTSGTGGLVTTTITYGYDPLYRLTSAAYSTGEVYTYTYDQVGNRQKEGVDGEVTEYVYDDANRLTSVDGVGYTWDDNGNLLDDGVRSYQYDAANWLVRVVSGTMTTTFTYNGDGDRVAKSENGVTTTYVVAILGLSQVLAETIDGETTRYVYGLDLLAQKDNDWAWHLSDGLGSVRQLANESGDVTLVQGYAAFGRLLWSEGSGTTGYGFTGEQWDSDAALLFLRARYYEPETGRFITEDRWLGSPQYPVSFHAYAYANNDPVTYVDPAGLYSCLTDEAWPPDLVPLCLLLDSSLEARRLFYKSLVTVMAAMNWSDASVLLDHYLAGSGSSMYFGRRLIRLVENDAATLIDSSRAKYLSYATQAMGGGIGKLPRQDDANFLSNTEGLPQSYAAAQYPVSRQLFIAIGGVWFNRFYGGTVEKESGSTYRISLLTTFGIDKFWSFAPNTEMYPDIAPGEVPENPPAEFNFAEFLGIPGWMSRPSWIPGGYIFPPGPTWSIYIPDEWGQSLETEGTAKSFWLHGLWAREEEFKAIDIDCNGWSLDEIVQGPIITRELLPIASDPSTCSNRQWINYSK